MLQLITRRCALKLDLFFFAFFVLFGVLLLPFVWQVHQNSHEVLEQSEYDLDAEADDLGWIPSIPSTQAPKQMIAMPSSAYTQNRKTRTEVGAQAYRGRDGPTTIHRTAVTQYLVLGENLKHDLVGVVRSLSTDRKVATQSPSGQVSGADMKTILKVLAQYAPLASEAQEDLNNALASRKQATVRRLQARRGSELEYGRAVHDEYDAAAVYGPAPRDAYGAATEATLRIAPKDVPAITCAHGAATPPPPYAPKLDRLDDCALGAGKTYNRMYSLDRARMNKPPAPPAAVRAHMAGVRRFVRRWGGLVTGDGGGDGPGALDDAYYVCYDEYQEDPELEACLDRMAQDARRGPFAVRAWAARDGRGATHEAMGKEEERVGFPELNKEWKKELGPGDSGDWVRGGGGKKAKRGGGGGNGYMEPAK